MAPGMTPPPRVVSLRHSIAHWASTLIHPMLFPFLTIVVITYMRTNSLIQTVMLALVSVAIATVPVSLLVFIQVKRGAWTDFDVSQRKQRYTLYPFTLACLGILAYVYAQVDRTGIAVRAVFSLLIANVVNALINLIYKVSAHATTAAACATLLWNLAPNSAWGPSAVAGAAIVGWSRVELKRHTTGQVLLGWLVGASSALLALQFHR